MARAYAVTFENVAVTASQDLFSILPGDDHPIILLGLSIDQSSDVGDSAEEMLRWKIIRGHTVSGLSGTSVTPRPLDPGDAAASFTAYINNLFLGVSGTAVDLSAGAFNIRSGLAIFWPPELTPMANQSNTSIVVRLMAAPADSLTMGGTLFIAEI